MSEILTFGRIGVEALRPLLVDAVEAARVGLADELVVGLHVGVGGEGPADGAPVRHVRVHGHSVGDACNNEDRK